MSRLSSEIHSTPSTMEGVFRFIFTVGIFVSVLTGTVLRLLPIGERDTQVNVSTLWQQSSVNGDSEMYLAQVDDVALSMAPYKFRILPTLLVRGIDSLLNLSPLGGYIVLNCLSFLMVGTGFTYYLMRVHGLSYAAGLVGGLMAVTSLPMQSMMLLPMNEPILYVAALCVFWSLHSQKLWLFVIAVCGAIAVKEVFIVCAVLYPVALVYRDTHPSPVLHADSRLNGG